MPSWRNLFSLFARNLGLDLGTANTLIVAHGKGIILEEPSVLAVNRQSRAIVAAGRKAKQMMGRTPANVMTVRPVKSGVIDDMPMVEQMMQVFFAQAIGQNDFARPGVLIGVPSGATEVETLALCSAARKAGAGQTQTYSTAYLAAIGAGIPVHEASGAMLVNIGAGCTEAALFSMDAVVTSQSIRMAGDEMDLAIINYARKAYGLLIGESTAEQVKLQIGSAFPLREEKTIGIRGRDLASGLPRSAVLHSEEVRECLRDVVSAITEIIQSNLEHTLPELSADIMNTGIVLCGGGALLRGLDRLLLSKIQVPITIAEDPLRCVARGTGLVMNTLYAHSQLQPTTRNTANSVS